MHVEPERLLKIAQVTRRVVLEQCSSDSCIASIRVFRDVMTAIYPGVDVYAMAVRAQAYNKAYVTLAAERGCLVSTGDPEYKERGCYGIGVGYPIDGREHTGWAGHLTAVVARRWMVDPSIDQASRPEQGIVLPPLISPVNEAFLRGREPLSLVTSVGSALQYQRIVDDTWTRSNNWTGADGFEAICTKMVASVIRAAGPAPRLNGHARARLVY